MTCKKRTPGLAGRVLAGAVAAVVMAAVLVMSPPSAEAAMFPTWGSTDTNAGTWLDSAGRLQAAWVSDLGSSANHERELLIVRHTLAGAADASWGTDSRSGAAGVRRIALVPPPHGDGYVLTLDPLDALATDAAGNITLPWNYSWNDDRGTSDFDDDIQNNETWIDRYSPDGTRFARTLAAHYESPTQSFPGRSETFIAKMTPLPDGSLAAEEETFVDFTATASRALWFGPAGDTRAAFTIDAQSTIDAASTNGDGRLYVTTSDGTLRRTSATGIDRTITSNCRFQQAYEGPLLPVAGPGGTFAAVCGTGDHPDTGTWGVQVRRYGADGLLTSTITSSVSTSNFEVSRPTSGAFDSVGRLWIGGPACTAYSGPVNCDRHELSTAMISAFDATHKLAGIGTSLEGEQVDGMRSLGDGRISFAAQRLAFNGADDVTVGLLGSTAAATVPAKPSAPSVAAGPGRVDVSWVAPGNGGSAITGYRVTPYKNGVALAPVDVGVVTTRAFTGLTNGSSYRFTVAARNAIGLGPASDLSVAAVPASVPGAPTDVRATAGNKRAIITWTAPVSDGGSPITGYKVRITANGTELQAITVGPVLTTTVLDLSPGTIYTFDIAAVNAIGTGPDSASSNPVTPPPAGFASWPKMVDRQFQDLLNRPATAAETSSWTGALQPATKPAGALPAELRTSADHVANVDPVTRLYSAYLARTPDRGGLVYWIGKRRRGSALSAISSAFASSAEFQTKYGSLSNRGFVELVYQNVLGRPGEGSGVTYWTNQLDLHRRTRGQVMIGFSESNEYIGKQAPRVTVIVLYVFMLGRTPTDTELSTEVATLNSGGTVAQLAGRILGSDAYATRIQGLQ